MDSMNLSSLISTIFSSQPADMLSLVTTPPLPDFELPVASSIEGKTKDGCRIVEQQDNTGDDPEDISRQTYLWISTSIHAVIIPVLFLLGVPGNILSAAVFYRQGLRERINLCVFCLALVDLVVVIAITCLVVEKTYRVFVGPFFFFITHFVALTGFSRASMFLSAVIAAERCFCVVSPLRAQRMLSTRTLAVVIGLVSFVIIGGMMIMVGPKFTVGCEFDVSTNTTSPIVTVTDSYLENKDILDIFDIFVFGITLPFTFLAVVIIATIITIAKLRSTVRWRQQSSSASGVQTTSSSETQMVALTWMLVATSVLFVLCSSPVVALQMSIYFVKELKHGGRYHNINQLSWSFIDLFRCLNSSLNFFIYYQMGSRFRQTLKSLLTCKDVDLSSSYSDRVSSTTHVSENSKQRVATVSSTWQKSDKTSS